jgi:hypothetical protein
MTTLKTYQINAWVVVRKEKQAVKEATECSVDTCCYMMYIKLMLIAITKLVMYLCLSVCYVFRHL